VVHRDVLDKGKVRPLIVAFPNRSQSGVEETFAQKSGPDGNQRKPCKRSFGVKQSVDD